MFARITPGKINSLSAESQREFEADWSSDHKAEIQAIQRRLEAAIRKICPAHLRAHIDDIVQLASLRVLRVMEKSQGDEGVETPSSSYLWKVAYTTTIDEIRKMRSRDRLQQNASAAALQGGAKPGALLSPEAATEGGRIGAAIRACLDTLLDSRRRAVVLHLQGHTVPETGELLGWPRKRAENQVYRGLADLRRCLKNKGFEP